MIIHELISKNADMQRVASASLVNGQVLKVIALAMRKGDVLKEHITHDPAKLIVIDGKVGYYENTLSVLLNKFDEVEIPVNTAHKLICEEDAVCLLVKYNKAV